MPEGSPPPPSPVLLSTPDLAPISRSGRRNRFPTNRYKDFLPGKGHGIANFINVTPPRAPSPIHEVPEQNRDVTPDPPNNPAPTRQPVQTKPDEFGLFKVYPSMPTSNPDELVSLDTLCDSGAFAVASNPSGREPSSSFGFSSVTETVTNVFAPFLNMTVFRLMSWFYGGSQMKSIDELNKLVNEVLLAPDFDTAHLEGFQASTELARLDAHEAKKNKDGTFSSSDGWTESSVKLRLPSEKAKFAKEEDAPIFDVPGLHHRNIISILRTVYQEDTFYEMNTMPYKEYVLHEPGQPPDRVWGEAYSADAHYAFHEEVQDAPRPEGDKLEHVVAGLQLWSDSTHLANFGDAALWPSYLYWSNQSKYTRAKPTSFASHHLAYIPKVSEQVICLTVC